MATPQGSGDAGRLILTNATPFVWNRSQNKPKGMRLWEFPEEVAPGESVVCQIAFAEGQGAHNGQASYEVELEEGQSGPGNPTFTVAATTGGLSVELPPEMRKGGWFSVPPVPHKVADAGWQKGCAVSFTLGSLGGQHASLRGGHAPRTFKGVTMAPLRATAGVSDRRGSRGSLIPARSSTPVASREADSGEGSGDRALGGFLGGLGRKLQAVTVQASGLLSDCGVVAPPRPAGGKGEGDWTVEWMKAYAPALAGLKLFEMSLPGTHDSGTTTMHNPIVAPWASCQTLTLEGQLEAGVRVLDLRCGYVGLDAQNYDKVADGVAVVHDTHRTTLSLRQALGAVKRFVQEHPSELVLLDFHRFPDLKKGPVHEKAAAVVVKVLEGVMVDPKFYFKPFGEIMSEQQGRVVVMWNAAEAKEPMFWPGVRQAWNGAETLQALHDMANTELGEKKKGLWSLPAVLPAGMPNPVPHIPEQLDDWFSPGGTWQENACIVSCDFVEETQVVRNCVGSCLVKMARAQAEGGGAAPAAGGGNHGGGKHGGGKHGGGGGGGGGHKKHGGGGGGKKG